MKADKWVPPAQPKDVDWARLAAFIDGEGSIGIRCRRNKSKPAYVISVVIANTDPALMVWLKTTFKSGKISTRSAEKFYDGGKHRHSYVWEVSARSAVWLLEGCLDYFVMKSEQAKICFELDGTMGPLHGGRGTLSSEVLERREEIKQKLHLVKARSLPLHDMKEVG